MPASSLFLGRVPAVLAMQWCRLATLKPTANLAVNSWARNCVPETVSEGLAPPSVPESLAPLLGPLLLVLKLSLLRRPPFPRFLAGHCFNKRCWYCCVPGRTLRCWICLVVPLAFLIQARLRSCLTHCQAFWTAVLSERCTWGGRWGGNWPLSLPPAIQNVSWQW